MVVKTRILLLIIMISLSVLFLLIWIFSNDLFKTKLMKFSNETKILLDKSNDYLHDKVIKNLQNSANFGFMHALIASIAVIIVSEIGDKTFFMAGIMAMRHSVLIVYTGAMSALVAMTIISALLGNVVAKFIPRVYAYYFSNILFVYFGIKMLKDGYDMPTDEETNEYEEVQQEEQQKTEFVDDLKSGGGGSGRRLSNPVKKKQEESSVMIFRHYISPILMEAFIMTFFAEWGDRSQITTIVLAASENLLGVVIGGMIGHGLCTGLAVIGGRFIAKRISPKTVTCVGGVIFLSFGISVFFIRPNK